MTASLNPVTPSHIAKPAASWKVTSFNLSTIALITNIAVSILSNFHPVSLALLAISATARLLLGRIVSRIPNCKTYLLLFRQLVPTQAISIAPKAPIAPTPAPRVEAPAPIVIPAPIAPAAPPVLAAASSSSSSSSSAPQAQSVPGSAYLRMCPTASSSSKLSPDATALELTRSDIWPDSNNPSPVGLVDILKRFPALIAIKFPELGWDDLNRMAPFFKDYSTLQTIDLTHSDKINLNQCREFARTIKCDNLKVDVSASQNSDYPITFWTVNKATLGAYIQNKCTLRIKELRLSSVDDLQKWVEIAPDLESVIFECPIPKEMVFYLEAHCSKWSQLTFQAYNEKEILPILKKCPNLRSLTIGHPESRDSPKVTHALLDVLAENCRELEFLSIQNGCHPCRETVREKLRRVTFEGLGIELTASSPSSSSSSSSSAPSRPHSSYPTIESLDPDIAKGSVLSLELVSADLWPDPKNSFPTGLEKILEDYPNLTAIRFPALKNDHFLNIPPLLKGLVNLTTLDFTHSQNLNSASFKLFFDNSQNLEFIDTKGHHKKINSSTNWEILKKLLKDNSNQRGTLRIKELEVSHPEGLGSWLKLSPEHLESISFTCPISEKTLSGIAEKCTNLRSIALKPSKGQDLAAFKEQLQKAFPNVPIVE